MFGMFKKAEPPPTAAQRAEAARRASATAAPPASRQNFNSSAGKYESPKPAGFGFVPQAEATPAVPAPAPAPAASSGFSFFAATPAAAPMALSFDAAPSPAVATAPASGFSFATAPAPAPAPASGFSFGSDPQPSQGFSFGGSSSSVAASPSSGFSFVAPPAQTDAGLVFAPAPATADPLMFGGLSFGAPAPASASADLLGPAAGPDTGLGVAVPLFASALKAAPVKKKRALKKPGFARDDEEEAGHDLPTGLVHAQSHAPESQTVPASSSAATPPISAEGALDRARLSSDYGAPAPSSVLGGLTLRHMHMPTDFDTAPALAPAPAPAPSFLAGLTVRSTLPAAAAPELAGSSSIASNSSSSNSTGGVLSGLVMRQPAGPGSFHPEGGGSFSLMQPRAPAQPQEPDSIAVHAPSQDASPDPSSAHEEYSDSPQYPTPPPYSPQVVYAPVSVSAAPSPAPAPAPAPASTSAPTSTPAPTSVPASPSSATAMQAASNDTAAFVKQPVALRASAPAPAPAPAPVALSEQQQLALIQQGVDTVARTCKLSLFDLRTRKQSTLSSTADLVNQISSARARVRVCEVEQNAAIEREDFAGAEELDDVIKQAHARVSSCEAQALALERQLVEIDVAIEQHIQSSVTSVTETVLKLKSHMELRAAALESFRKSSGSRDRTLADRVHGEEEQLRLKQEHVQLDERLVVGEQEQVEAAIESQTSANTALVVELSQLHSQLQQEIAELERTLVAKRAQEVEGKVSSIRDKFSKQLSRLQAKRDVVTAEANECAAEAEAIAKARRDMEERSREDAALVQSSVRHAVVCAGEAAVGGMVRDALLFTSLRRSLRVGAAPASASASVAGAGAVADLAKLKATLERATVEQQTLTGKRGSLETAIASFRDSIAAIDVKLPLLAEEKKAVVAARKFKEAAKVQADLKQLTEEKAELEARVSETCAESDRCEEQLRTLNSDLECYRARITTLEAEADGEKIRDLKDVLGEIRRRLRRLSKEAGKLGRAVDGPAAPSSSFSLYTSGVMLLEAERDLAADELTVLCSKHCLNSSLPDETDSDVEDAGAVVASAAAASPVAASGAAAADAVLSAVDSDTLGTVTVASDEGAVAADLHADLHAADVDDAVPVQVESEAVDVAASSDSQPDNAPPSKTHAELSVELAEANTAITDLESAMEVAVAEENFEKADELQDQLDAAYSRVTRLKEALAAAADAPESL